MDSESAIAIYRCLAWPISRILYLPSLSIIFLTFEILLFTVTGKTNYAVSLTDSVTATISHEMQYLLSVKNDRVLCKLLSELEFFHYLQHVSEKNRQWSTTAWIYQNRNKLKTVWSGRLMVIPLKWYSV